MITLQGRLMFGMMIVSTIAVLIDPARMAEVDAVHDDVWIAIRTGWCLLWLLWRSC
jgi:hypothetical protein